AALWPYLAFVFTFGMGLFYMQLGDVISNIVYAIILGMTISRCLFAFARIPGRETADIHRIRRLRQTALVILLFCTLEYIMWTASCFGDSTKAPEIIYYIADSMLSLSFPLALAGLCRKMRKEQEKEKEAEV
nr:hypothetical protein [Lachnospiraceae bacterium]